MNIFHSKRHFILHSFIYLCNPSGINFNMRFHYRANNKPNNPIYFFDKTLDIIRKRSKYITQSQQTKSINVTQSQ